MSIELLAARRRPHGRGGLQHGAVWEFAWHILEPHEGTFDFDLFDRAIDVLGKAGIKTIMCTRWHAAALADGALSRCCASMPMAAP
jgi:hypothetical protein